ncbi:Uncharacterized damage-inducible protein DinB (forms a four-helix bundle) [Pedobacter westerhofensis]|uniref:Uncharacterized damage-inducible protein DinB (Forms a four-helix bundle) n=1 Tax=Pedobacter westerhofensis TaxID=425512 RepID=A0A521AD98_9SPHI|nr:DinB family protein [Pedobacter westerhofensis]SMO32748.1 Uncharacterized damage-inducible protein DinB (forms a four-helix bundle) [Pedobacter westerhofensis]
MLRQFCKYNNWANSLLLNTLVTHSDVLPESCIKLFSHIVNAQIIWLCRINGVQPQVTVWELHEIEACSLLLNVSSNELSELDYPETAESPIIKYANSTGDFYETSVADILLHIFNHGTYHRAQIAKEMKINNLKPINTDYIQFIRLQ